MNLITVESSRRNVFYARTVCVITKFFDNKTLEKPLSKQQSTTMYAYTKACTGQGIHLP